MSTANDTPDARFHGLHVEEKLADALQLALDMPAPRARDMARFGAAAVTGHALYRAFRARIDAQVSRDMMARDLAACQQVAAKAGIATFHRYALAGPYHGDSYDGDRSPAEMLEDAVRQRDEARAALAALAAGQEAAA